MDPNVKVIKDLIHSLKYPKSSICNDVRIKEISTYPLKPQFSQEFQALVLSGGGKKGIVQLGMLHNIYVNNLCNISHVKAYFGCSVGSIICFLLIIGYKPVEILSHICTRNFGVKNMNFLNILSRFGICAGESIFQIIEQITVEKLGFLPTLSELYDLTGKHLVVTVHNLTHCRTEFLDHISHPDLSCVEALKMSSTIPFLFERYIYDKQFYLDGGESCNYPIEECDKRFPNYRVLGLSVNRYYAPLIDDSSVTIIDYVKNILYVPCRVNTQESKKYTSRKIVSVMITVDEDNELDLDPQSSSRFKLFSLGYQIMSDLTQNKPKEKVD